ncbi:hypothetical protein P691DRAFT_661764 [Macrolepiota fuliginosa MF-IS2]|uniref:Pentatricopeptide repeat protein n=1 Tax=Macrolepiota fuliginosa MF-IS2 TaxID=1400762 RepID=A0A9P6C7K5_9AGAR|nr:hypothetical protein P691DRAFT_661764 [Macrolepiota fuliginosa MF-IS2]
MGPVTLQEAELSSAIPPLDRRVQEAPFLSGRPWSRQPLKPLRANSRGGYGPQRRVVISSLGDEGENVEQIHQDMLHVLATTSSAKEGWEAYGVLSQLQQQFDTAGDDNETTSIIPFAHLHRLARVIVRKSPKTRTRFLQLLSVLTTIRNYGGMVHLHEWNALIDHAGKGLRKTRPEDFNNSLSIYYDMVYDRPPGSRFSDAGFDDILNPHPESDPIDGHEPHTPAIEPDIHTYTTLIDIAARTGHPPLLYRATMLLKHAKLPPNRITHLSLLKYFTAKKQLSGIRSTLLKMREQNLELGVDGLNACMWAYGHSKRIDTVMMIYRLLRHNVLPEDYNEYDNIAYVQERLRIEEEIIIPPEWKPNEVTFTLMIQTMAYHGNLLAALSVFLDMLSSPNVEQGAPLVLDENGDLQPTLYSPTIHVFRAIILGFSHHGIDTNTNPTRSNMLQHGLEWNLENLQNIFEKFLELPPDTKISESTIFWTLNSFSKTTNHDIETLRTIWRRLEDRFGRFRGGPKHRLTRWRHKLFPETEKTEDSG